MPRHFRSAVLLVLAIGSATAARAATPDNYQAKTTRDMIALCSADPASPDYATSVAFCHGFAVGAYQYYTEIAGNSPTARFVCLPNPPPSRSDAIAQFIVWARAHPESMETLPVDSMFRYLAEKYPCHS